MMEGAAADTTDAFAATTPTSAPAESNNRTAGAKAEDIAAGVGATATEAKAAAPEQRESQVVSSSESGSAPHCEEAAQPAAETAPPTAPPTDPIAPTAAADNPTLPPERSHVVMHVLCVTFHHRNGPQIEYAMPAFPGSPVFAEDAFEPDGSRPAIALPTEWSFLPFLCLPDGAHASEEEFIYFHLPPVKAWGPAYSTTLFGLACFRQIQASELLIKTADITRTAVQKAVVVLANEPILGSVRTKLGMVTQALFAQRDFSKLDLLETLFASLKSVKSPIPDSTLYTGISLRELVNKFKQKTLQLFKLLLLERRVLFFGQSVERLSSYQYSLVSLVPELLRSLQDVGSPGLSSKSSSPVFLSEDTSNETTKTRSRKFGLPLRIFGQGSFFQPYIPLQQMDVLMSPDTKAFLVGTSNSIFTQHKGCAIEVVVNVDTGMLDFKNPTLGSILSLTAADKRFMDEITKSVVSTWSQEADPSLNQQIQFEGSDEDIRSRFDQYLCSVLLSVKAAAQPVEPPQSADAPPPKPKDYLVDFNTSWVKAWQQTNNFLLWEAVTGNDILEGATPGHPKEMPSTISILQSTMTARLQELSKNIAPLQQNLGKAMETAGNRTSVIAGESSRTLQSSASQMLSAVSGWYAERRREWSASSTTVKTTETIEAEKANQSGGNVIEVTESFEDITIEDAKE